MDDIEEVVGEAYHKEGAGRPPRKPMGIFKALIIKRVQQIPSERELYRRLWKDPDLREVCDIEEEQKPYHPSARASNHTWLRTHHPIFEPCLILWSKIDALYVQFAESLADGVVDRGNHVICRVYDAVSIQVAGGIIASYVGTAVGGQVDDVSSCDGKVGRIPDFPSSKIYSGGCWSAAAHFRYGQDLSSNCRIGGFIYDSWSQFGSRVQSG